MSLPVHTAERDHKKKIDIHNFHNLTPPLLLKLKSFQPKKLLSQIYKLFSHHDNTVSIPTDKWTSDLNRHQSDINWKTICNNTFAMSSNSKIQLIQYKVLHRTHITTHKMFNMGFIDNNTCTHCPTAIDNHFHAFWLCTPIWRFWSEVMRELSEILNLSIPLTPSIALLGDLSALSIPQHLQTFILIALTLAKKTILLNWKDRNKLSVSHWLNLLTDHSNLEQLTSTVKDNLTTFNNTWSPFLQYIQS